MKWKTVIILVLLMGLGMGGLLLRPQDARALNPNHQCSFCHEIHGAPGFDLLKADTIEVLCLTCHGPGGISVLKAEIHEGVTCSVCHDPHDNLTNWTGGTNLELVGTIQDATRLAKIATTGHGIKNVVFESRGTDVGQPARHSFADNIGDFGVLDGICEQCHDVPHNWGRTCTICHTHVRGFQPND